MKFDADVVRRQFPQMSPPDGSPPPIFFDNPGGTQVPLEVIEAVSNYYRYANANTGGDFATSRRTDRVLTEARQAMAAFLNAPDPRTIVFGANMTTLTFHLARSVADTIRPGDEIILTYLDHDANITPWVDLQAVGAVIKFVDINRADCTLNMDAYRAALSERTKLVAITHASNALGTIPDVATITRMAHAVGAQVFVDAVQYAPHGPIDVQALDCDFLACSAYKFFGPHVGVLYGKAEHLARFTPHKVRPAKDTAPYRWETGTLNHEGLAGVAAAVEYLAEIGERFGAHFAPVYEAQCFAGRRRTLKTAMHAVREYEKGLAARLLAGLCAIDDVRIYGLATPDRRDE